MGHVKKLKPCAMCGEDTYTKYCPLPKECKRLAYNKNQKARRLANNIKDITQNKQSIRDTPKVIGVKKRGPNKNKSYTDKKWLVRNYGGEEKSTQGSYNSFNL